MKGRYIGQEGKENLYYMGCYGIGVSRTLAALYEQCVVKDKNNIPCGFVLPKSVAPFSLQIVVKQENEEKKKLAENLYQQLTSKGVGVILDDRENITLGAKMKDVKILGTPYMIVIGDKQVGNLVEFENNLTGEKLEVEIEKLTDYIT